MPNLVPTNDLNRSFERILDLISNVAFPLLLEWDLLKRPDYGYGMLQAARMAAGLKIDRISALEFGVAAGNGLIAMENTARAVARLTGVQVDVYGFDTGKGMPEAVDYRDMPYLWQSGFFKMDVAALKTRLQSAQLVLGEFAETVPNFVREYDPAPIGFISFDADYYSSTVMAFHIFEEDHFRFLPRVLCYFDDVIGGDFEYHSTFTGELLAIDEYNHQHESCKIAKINGLSQKRRRRAWWHEQMYVHHRFAHPLYNQHVFPDKNWQLPLPSRRVFRWKKMSLS